MISWKTNSNWGLQILYYQATLKRSFITLSTITEQYLKVVYILSWVFCAVYIFKFLLINISEPKKIYLSLIKGF